MSRRPNFIVFVTDQHRADHLGCYGNSIVQTPHIDALAARGTRFEKFHVACPVCMPNRASLMTGRLPSSHLVRHNGVPLARQNVTFTDLLRAEGYRNALIGKGHLQNMTGRKGAERKGATRDGLELDLDDPWYDGEDALAWQADPERDVETPFYGFDQVRVCSLHGDQVEGHYTKWFREKCPDWAQLTGPANALPDGRYTVPQAWRTRVPEDAYPTRYVQDEAIAFLEAQADDPFCLVVSFPDPHHPFTPPGRYWDMYDPDEMPTPATFDDKLDQPLPPVPELREALADKTGNAYVPLHVTERQAREALALTYGMISMIDDAVGAIMGRLADLGLAEDTVVAFTSDHGDYMGDRGVILKFGMHYREIVRVPFIWMDPARERKGEASDRLAGTIDIAPTILGRAGVQAPFGTQGIDVFDCGRAHAGMVVEDYAISYLRDPDSRGHFVSFITGRWRLTRYESSDWGELFDLENDPGERRNLWDDPAHRGIRGELHEALARQLIANHDRTVSPTRRA